MNGERHERYGGKEDGKKKERRNMKRQGWKEREESE